MACGGGDEPPEPAPKPVCSGPTPTRGTPIDGALAIGTGDASYYRPYVDGDRAQIVVGSQGGYMAIPVFRVDATLLGTDGFCTYLKVIATVDDGSDPHNFDIKLPNSSPSDAFWYFGTLPLFLASDESQILGHTVTYNASFYDDGKEADAAVSLLLVDDD